jgi:hypothetical protein
MCEVHGWASCAELQLDRRNSMARYLIRLGSARNTWMVWDRVKRRPAVLDDRELVRLSRLEAETAVGHLIGRNSANFRCHQGGG